MHRNAQRRTFDPSRLAASLRYVEDWSLPSHYADTGVHHRYRRALTFKGFGWVLDEFAPIVWAQLAEVGPGGFIACHRDAGPYRERWHVPIVAAGVFIQNGDETTPVVGEAFQVRHWEPHSVWNPTVTPRVHLMIDRDLEAAPTGAFELYPPPDAYALMIPKR